MKLKDMKSRYLLFLGTAIFVVISSAILNQFHPVVITNHQDAKISLAPFGYSFEGRKFTGVLFSTHVNKKLKRLSFVLNGKLHFKDIHWYSVGQTQLVVNYWLGLNEGFKKVWYHTGEPRSISYYENGKRHGEAWGWFPDGQTREFSYHERGREVVIRSFTSNSKPFHNWVRTEKGIEGLKGDRNCDKSVFARQ
jgi:hypothetical protein